MLIYVARDVTLEGVIPRRGKETLGHDGYGRNVLAPRTLNRVGAYWTDTCRAVCQTEKGTGACW